MDLKDSRMYVLVTGANSGLGLSVCLRLVDEFVAKSGSPPDNDAPYPQNLTLILTTRTLTKSNATISTIRRHLQRYAIDQQARVTLQPESVDLTHLLSVRRLARKLAATVPHLSAIVCNAGIGGWTGIDWSVAIWTVLTDWVQSVTFPTFKLSATGLVTQRQLSGTSAGLEGRPVKSGNSKTSSAAVEKDGWAEEPLLGEVFTANLFGHYLLAHWLMPLLSSHSLPEQHEGRVILVSSIETAARHFDISDPQRLLGPESYESSKRLSDILALTSRLPSTSAWVSSFLTPSSTSLASQKDESTKSTQTGQNPKVYVCHPGVCATAIVPLPWILNLFMILGFYIARFLGSPWHPTLSYLGATSPVWLALSDQKILDNFETPAHPSKGASNGALLKKGESTTIPIKWGSMTDRLGNEGVWPTEVEGWGFQGLDGDRVENRIGRRRGAKRATLEDREAFQQSGREAWKFMEELREEWEGLLEGVDEDV